MLENTVAAVSVEKKTANGETIVASYYKENKTTDSLVFAITCDCVEKF